MIESGVVRLVLDTDVMVAAVRSAAGASRHIVTAAVDRRLVLLLSPVLLLEYEAVLKRPEHLRAAAARVGDIDAVLDEIAATCERVDLHYMWRPQLADVADEMVLETAVNGRAECLVTFNVRHFRPAADRFGIEVARPAAIVGRI